MTGRRSPALAVFALLFFWYFLTSTGEPPAGDAYEPFLGAIRIIKGDGIGATKVMPGQTLLIVPIALATRTIVMGLSDVDLRIVTVVVMSCLFPALLTAGTAALLVRVAMRLGFTGRQAALAALLFGLATPAAVYAKNYFPQTTEAFFVVASALGVLEARERAPAAAPLVVAGLAFGALLLVKAVAIAYLPAFALFVYWMRPGDSEPRRDDEGGDSPRGGGARRVLLWGAGAVALAVLYLPYNAAARGHALHFGYGVGRDALWGFATPTLIGLQGLLLSPGKGLLFYAPVLLLAIPGGARMARRDLACALLFAGVALGALLLHAHWWAWHGDNAWGPRYLVPALPLLALAAAETLRGVRPSLSLRTREGIGTLAIGALIALSLAIQALGAAYRNNDFQTMTYDTVLPRYRQSDGPRGPLDDELHLHWIPHFSPLVGHAWMLGHALRGDPAGAYLADYPWRALRPDGAWAPRVPDPPPSIDLWVTRLPRTYPTARGVATTLTALAVVGLAASGVGLARRLRAAPGAPRPPA